MVLVNAVIGFLPEGKAEVTLDAIRHMLSLTAVVLRDGRRREIAAEELVPGLRVDEAAVTGESVAVDKVVGPVAPQAPIGDRRSMAS